MFSLAPRLFPQHYNFCSDNNFHFIRSAYAREVAPKSSSGEKLMTKVEGNLAEPALGDLNVKPASLFWVCVCFSKAFMSCLVKNTAWLCCVLCYVQNEMFYIYFFLFTFSCVVILLWILHDNISVYGKMCEINHNCFHIKCIKGKYLCLNALSCILTCYMSVFISPCIYWCTANTWPPHFPNSCFFFTSSGFLISQSIWEIQNLIGIRPWYH